MFDTLIASRAGRLGARAWWSAGLVVLLHGGLIAAAVWVTRGEAVARLVVIQHPVPPLPERVNTSRMRVPFRAPEIPPVSVPDGIPIPDIHIPLPSSESPSWTGHTSWPDIATGDEREPRGPIDASLAEDLPDLLSAPPPAYPAHLRRLGVQGRVVVRAVVDTLGRVEHASIAVVATPHADLISPVREALKRALFRPARLHGQAVRVLVEIPFEFRLTR